MSDQIQAEAAAWLARLQAEDRTADDLDAWQTWMQSSPERRAAFETATAAWEAAGAIGRPAKKGSDRRVSRRALVTCGVLGVVAISPAVWWRTRPLRFATGKGEQRRIALSDGSSVTMDTETELTVSMGRNRRRIELTKGRAHFNVAPDHWRPFTVRAGEHQVVAIGTAFDVSRENETVSVVLLHGLVAITPASQVDAMERTRRLRPGDRAIYERNGVLRVDQPDLDRLTAWRSGRLVFDNETLQAAAAEMNKYNLRQIVIEEDISGIRISGVYESDDPEAFAASVGQLVGAQVAVQGRQIALSKAGEAKIH